MTKVRLRWIAAAAAALGLSGCVTMGTYNTLQKQTNDLQSQLDEIHKEAKGLQTDLGAAKQSNAELSQAKSGLEAQKSDLEKAKSALESKTAELEKAQAELVSKTAELSAQKAALEADKAALLKQAQDKQAQYDSLVGDLKKEVNEGQLKITQYKNMLTLDVADKILFDSGHADLKPAGKKVLTRVGEALAQGKSADKVIRVVGHTDNVPLAVGAAYASNWELSTARATTVVRFLQDTAKLDPTRLIAEGRGEWSPVAPNDTPENRQKNRRIEITLIDRNLVEAISVNPAPQDASPTARP